MIAVIFRHKKLVLGTERVAWISNFDDGKGRNATVKRVNREDEAVR